MPSPVLGEIGYLLQPRVGPQAEVAFLHSFGEDGFRVVELEDGDMPRIAELVDTYIDLPLGIVDAAVIAIAERLGLPRWRLSITVTSRSFARGTSGRSRSCPDSTSGERASACLDHAR